jgi:6-phosphogluconolactonase
MLPQQKIEVVADSSSLADRAVEELVRLAEETTRAGGMFSVALAGGSTPQQMYTRLSAVHLRWDRIHVFLEDERCLPPEGKDSNYHMANEALLKVIPMPKNNIHRIHGELPAEPASKNYEGDPQLFFGGTKPRLNLVLLGLGSDGHIASLFPGTRALGETTHWVVPVTHRVPPPPPMDRVTLTIPVLNTAANILSLASGAEKEQILGKVLQDSIDSEFFPAQAVKPVDGNLHWLVDQDAASGLPLATTQ